MMHDCAECMSHRQLQHFHDNCVASPSTSAFVRQGPTHVHGMASQAACIVTNKHRWLAEYIAAPLQCCIHPSSFSKISSPYIHCEKVEDLFYNSRRVQAEALWSTPAFAMDQGYVSCPLPVKHRIIMCLCKTQGETLTIIHDKLREVQYRACTHIMQEILCYTEQSPAVTFPMQVFSERRCEGTLSGN